MMLRKAPKLVIIAPCHNEEEVLGSTTSILLSAVFNMCADGMVAEGSGLLYVDDGSTDSTWRLIVKLSEEYPSRVHGLRLNRHCGHQEALIAGMEKALEGADVCVTIDADLQDDVAVIPEMIRMYMEGADVVYGVRKSRGSDSWFKKATAKGFYNTMHGLGAECVANHADFRLMSHRAVADLMDYGERNLFLRGLVPLLGYRQECVYYERKERSAGKTKYPLRKMLDFAISGITSFSVRPVRMLFWIGLVFMLTALGIGIYVLIRHFSGETIEGWTSLILSIWFCTGILLMGLGIIGEYVGKIYIEVKRRPRYRISDEV